MNGRTGSWWGWVVFALVMLAVFGGSEDGVPVVPLVIGAIVLSKVLGRRSGVPSGPHRRRPAGGAGHLPGIADRLPGQEQPPAARPGTWTAPPQDGPMPTIDVPRYPGDGPVPGPAAPTYGAPPGPPPSPQGSPTYGPAGAGAGAGAAGVPHTSSDPVVSLGQLHLSRCGRDLEAAVQRGTPVDVSRVLDEVSDLSTRMQEMLDGAGGTAGSGRSEFRQGLRALDRLVEDARGDDPSGVKVRRVVQACQRMGQTGRHE